MEINLQTKVAALLEAYPALEETLLELSPAFAKLRNPVLRHTVAKVATLQQAANIAGISPAQMVQTLRKAAGLSITDITDSNTSEENTDTPPEWFDEQKITIRFDASPLINSGQNPMQEIICQANKLEKDYIMELTAPFKPAPIIDLLKSKGFKAWHGQGNSYFTKNTP